MSAGVETYRKPYLDSSVLIGWLKRERIGDIDRGAIGDHLLRAAERGDYVITISALTFAEVHKVPRSGAAALSANEDERILAFSKTTTSKSFRSTGRLERKRTGSAGAIPFIRMTRSTSPPRSAPVVMCYSRGTALWSAHSIHRSESRNRAFSVRARSNSDREHRKPDVIGDGPGGRQ